MKPLVVHYAGRLEWRSKRGMVTMISPGFAACCTGDRARRAARSNTLESGDVTCRACLAIMAKAGIAAHRGEADHEAGDAADHGDAPCSSCNGNGTAHFFGDISDCDDCGGSGVHCDEDDHATAGSDDAPGDGKDGA